MCVTPPPMRSGRIGAAAKAAVPALAEALYDKVRGCA